MTATNDNSTSTHVAAALSTHVPAALPTHDQPALPTHAPDAVISGASAQVALDTAQEGIQAVAKMLGALGESGKSVEKPPPQELRPVFDCLRYVLQSAKRDQAIENLVKRVAFEMPGCSVRGVVGRGEVNKLYDAKLGWLANGNEVRQSMVERFKQSKPPKDAKLKGAERVSLVDQWWAIDLTTDVTPRRFVLFVQPKTRRAEDPTKIQSGEKPNWLVHGGDLLADAVASRPVVAMPRFVDVIGHRPMITVLTTLALAALLSLWPVRYPVACNAIVQALHARVVASPFDATLRMTHVKPGDQVTAGQVLLELDGRPLRMELDSIEADIQAMEKDRNVALAMGDVAASQKAVLQAKKLSHRRDLLRDRLGKLEIVSPVDGIVIGGDLERFVDAPLTSGQSLMEIAALDRVEVEVEIPEFEIAMLRDEAEIRLRFGAVGGESLHSQLEQVYPAAEVREDRNVFVGRMTIENADRVYRPGMKGNATTYGPLRPLAWSYVRGAWERVLWSVGY